MKLKIIATSLVLLGLQSCANRVADNTEVNERDYSSNELTADQQSNSAGDMDITRRIRQDIMKEQNFSTNAQNVKIITVNGNVTLKGSVQSRQEKTSILRYARRVAGVTNVTDEMSVVTESN